MGERPTVVLLHGLARSHRSLARLRRSLEAAGYPTWSRSYPSRRQGVEQLASEIGEQIREELGNRPLFAVTHSMGGIIVRQLARALPWRGSVLIAPPNRGSAVARLMRDAKIFQWFYGPAGQQLGAEPSEIERWPAPPRPCGVIAGTQSFSLRNPTSWLTRATGVLDGPSDGTVAVSETQLDEDALDGFVTLDANHTFIANHPQTARLVVRFVSSGRF
ncbi:MAG: alpha/beta fold hydrolase [Myxococcales bacterium]|nr:alpha/beta fold hydrolase [Myxococcales bacterium]